MEILKEDNAALKIGPLEKKVIKIIEDAKTRISLRFGSKQQTKKKFEYSIQFRLTGNSISQNEAFFFGNHLSFGDWIQPNSFKIVPGKKARDALNKDFQF